MINIIYSLGTGLVCGIIFSLIKLPIPAPPTIHGIAGIVGIWLGYMLINQFR